MQSEIWNKKAAEIPTGICMGGVPSTWDIHVQTAQGWSVLALWFQYGANFVIIVSPESGIHHKFSWYLIYDLRIVLSSVETWKRLFLKWKFWSLGKLIVNQCPMFGSVEILFHSNKPQAICCVIAGSAGLQLSHCNYWSEALPACSVWYFISVTAIRTYSYTALICASL